ncbi:MAG: L-lactate dehydrogenase [Treponemataceae bacterium]
MGNKVTIIGAGSVGSSIAYALTIQGTASEIVLIDINTEKAFGEAMDIRQGIPYCPAGTIYAGTYADAKDSDIVILTSGLARKKDQSRLDLAQANVNITKAIIPEITKAAPNAIYVIVANPVDILTYQFHKTSGLPENRIIGSGTSLDTARLVSRLAESYAISQNDVNAYVFGEHGDSSFVPWSIANISGIPVDMYKKSISGVRKNIDLPSHEEIETYVRKSGGEIIQRKGATFYAVAISVCHICKCIFNGSDTALTVATMMHGEYGISDTCLSTLSLIGRNGVTGRLDVPLTDSEVVSLQKSANALKEVISQLTF